MFTAYVSNKIISLTQYSGRIPSHTTVSIPILNIQTHTNDKFLLTINIFKKGVIYKQKRSLGNLYSNNCIQTVSYKLNSMPYEFHDKYLCKAISILLLLYSKYFLPNLIVTNKIFSVYDSFCTKHHEVEVV